MYIGLHVKHPKASEFLSDFDELDFSW